VISFLFPTTGRRDRATTCLRELHRTTRGHDIEILLAIDEDPRSRTKLRRYADKISYSQRYRGPSDAWNAALKMASGDLIVFAADDLRWQEGWLDAALDAHYQAPDALVGFNDGHWDEDLSTHYLMPRHFIIEVLGGRVAWPCYRHSFNDLETNMRAKRAGRYHWVHRPPLPRGRVASGHGPWLRLSRYSAKTPS
jgi:glycosyltransferase involved in cell wall biosynthesis